MKKLYIAYGSNLNLGQMSIRCPTAKVVGSSVIQDHSLVFRGSRTGSYATIEPNQGSQVPVLLWEVSPQDERNLDVYEGYPQFYQKETMALPLGNTQVDAMVYVMPDHHQLGMPSQRYINIIEEGYKTAGFDPDILYQAIEDTKLQMDAETQTFFGNLQMW